MGISIYYTARRGTPLSAIERTELQRIKKEHAVEDQIDEYNRTGSGPNWESFCVYDPRNLTKPNVIFEGATGLPTNSEDALWNGLQHWCAALAKIRLILSGAEWDVRVDDHDIVWDDVNSCYDPSQ